MMKHKIFLILIFIPIFNYAQIEIWTFDGTLINTDAYRIDSNIVYYLAHNGETKAMERKEIFAIIDKGDTLFLVQNDLLNGYDKTELLMYLKGLHDGFKHKAQKIFIFNFLLGITSSIALPLYGFSGVYVTFPNILSTFAFGSLKVRNLPETKDSLYLSGYEVSAKKKKVLSAASGSLGGLVTGTLILYLILKQ